jgi:large subunit ribosomal protein L3
MQSALLVTKGKSTQIFDESRKRIPVTELVASGLHLLGVKNVNRDGYCALKFVLGKSKKIDKPTAGQIRKVGIQITPRFVREVRIKDNGLDRLKIEEKENEIYVAVGESLVKIGQPVSPKFMFSIGDKLSVTGKSKGKGFQGGVKRHGFSGGPKTHGQSDRWRAPGSVGPATTPGRTFKGQRMAGRMGSDRVTIHNLLVVEVGDDRLVVKGLVPGNIGGLLEVKLAK